MEQDENKRNAKWYALEQKRRHIARGARDKIKANVISALIETEFDIRKAARLCKRGVDVVENIARAALCEEVLLEHKKTLITKIVEKMWSEGVEGDSFADRKVLLEMLAPEMADSGVRKQLIANKGLAELNEQKSQRVLPSSPKDVLRIIQQIDPALGESKEVAVLDLDEIDDPLPLISTQTQGSVSVEHYTQASQEEYSKIVLEEDEL